MPANSSAPGTVTLHRVLRAPPERLYRAFLDPDAMAKWLPPHGFTGRVLELLINITRPFGIESAKMPTQAAKMT